MVLLQLIVIVADWSRKTEVVNVQPSDPPCPKANAGRDDRNHSLSPRQAASSIEPMVQGSWSREFRFYDTTRQGVIPELSVFTLASAAKVSPALPGPRIRMQYAKK